MIDLTKQYKTRDGREVKVFMVDAAGAYPVLGAVKEEDGWNASSWHSDGAFLHGEPNHSEDLIEVKPERTVWVGFRRAPGSPTGYLAFMTRESPEAIVQSELGSQVVACIPVTFREGDGL